MIHYNYSFRSCTSSITYYLLNISSGSVRPEIYTLVSIIVLVVYVLNDGFHFRISMNITLCILSSIDMLQTLSSSYIFLVCVRESVLVFRNLTCACQFPALKQYVGVVLTCACRFTAHNCHRLCILLKYTKKRFHFI